MPSINLQLFTNNLKCSSVCPRTLLDPSRFTIQYARAVGQDVFPRKCVLLGTSKSVRKSMKLLDVSGMGGLGL